jgi:hypothetical protein
MNVKERFAVPLLAVYLSISAQDGYFGDPDIAVGSDFITLTADEIMTYPTFEESSSGSIRQSASGKIIKQIASPIRLLGLNFTSPRWTNIAILGGCIAFWSEAISHLIKMI